MEMAAAATVPPVPTAKIEWGASDVPTGTVTLTAAVPLGGTTAGVPLRTTPVALSRWKLRPSPGAKPAIVPVSVAGRLVTEVGERVRLASPTVTAAPSALSRPRQAP